MKKIILLIALALTLVGCGKKSDENIVNVYNWGEYIDKSILDDFEKETGIKVQYDNYVTNEDLYVKVKKGGDAYDVIVPSDYMIEKMAKENLIQKLNYEDIKGSENNDPTLQKMLDESADGYTLPYFWGTMGIVYNKKMVTEPVDSWDILWNQKYKNSIIMLDSSRDSIGIALLKLGYSLNSKDAKELEEAKNLLIEQKPLIMAYQVDETKGYMINNEAALAVMYSGDAYDAIRQNPDLAYAIPKEGTNLWVDGLAIPTNAPHIENAKKFIEYLQKPEVAAKNAAYIGYSTPNLKAKELLDDQMKNSEVTFPDLTKYKFEIFKDPAEAIEIYDKHWTEIISE